MSGLSFMDPGVLTTEDQTEKTQSRVIPRFLGGVGAVWVLGGGGGNFKLFHVFFDVFCHYPYHICKIKASNIYYSYSQSSFHFTR